MDGTDLGGLIREISVWMLPVLLAITLHEAAHGFVAWRLGDDTAYKLGRVTLNPLKHIDLFGTIILPGLLLVAGGFLFGWAKPVPMNPRKFRDIRRDIALTAAAGPLSNLLLAMISAILVHGLRFLPEAAQEWAVANIIRSIIVNVILAVFNMLPLPMFDGGKVMAAFLPLPLARFYFSIERHGMMILILLLFILPFVGRNIGVDLNILGWVLSPAISFVGDGVLALAGHEVSFRGLHHCVDSGAC